MPFRIRNTKCVMSLCNGARVIFAVPYLPPVPYPRHELSACTGRRSDWPLPTMRDAVSTPLHPKSRGTRPLEAWWWAARLVWVQPVTRCLGLRRDKRRWPMGTLYLGAGRTDRRILSDAVFTSLTYNGKHHRCLPCLGEFLPLQVGDRF